MAARKQIIGKIGYLHLQNQVHREILSNKKA